jgi:H+/Cl- antiporter ClcA
MWEKIKDTFTDLLIEILELWPRFQIYVGREGKAFVRWLVIALAVGGVVGTVGAAFHHAVEWATEARLEHPWLLFCLPLAGLAIVGLYQLCHMENDGGTEFVLASVRDSRYLRLTMVPLIFISTVLTHLCGGSAGREGAALQIGGGISAAVGRFVKLDEQDERIATMTGMAAGFSALFGTPLSAAVFAMEVESVGMMQYAAIVPCFVSSLLANIISHRLGCAGTSFLVHGGAVVSLGNLAKLILMGGLCGMLANLFCRTMHGFHMLYRRYCKSRWVKAVAGGVLVIGLSLLFGPDYNGAGMNIIAQAMEGRAVPWAFVLKIIFTGATLAAGYKGGEIVPSFFVGATFGCVFAPLLGLSASFGAAVGMVSVFCGVTNSPLTSVLLGYELFNGVGVAPLALAVAVSYMLSGYTGLYHEQKIMYSKTKTVFIDKIGHEEYFGREKREEFVSAPPEESTSEE